MLLEGFGGRQTLDKGSFAVEMNFQIPRATWPSEFELDRFFWSETKLFTIDDRKVSSHILQPGRPKLHIVKIPTWSQ